MSQIVNCVSHSILDIRSVKATIKDSVLLNREWPSPGEVAGSESLSRQENRKGEHVRIGLAFPAPTQSGEIGL